MAGLYIATRAQKIRNFIHFPSLSSVWKDSAKLIPPSLKHTPFAVEKQILVVQVVCECVV